MARRGRVRVDTRQLQRVQKKMEKLAKADFDNFCEAAAKELAARLLAKVIKRTPVGVYPEGSGKTGGTLRRGWTAGKKQWSEKDGNVRTHGIGGGTGFAQSLEVVKKGDIYELVVINPVHYASFVEYGRRTRNGKGWVQGRFMMTISAAEVEQQAPQIIEKKLMKLLKDTFEG